MWARFLPGVERREPALGPGEAPLEQHGGPDVARPQAVAAAAVPRLGGRVQREPARPLEPQLVAGAVEEREQREAVARRPVTQARALAQRSGAPDELAAGQQEALEDGIAGLGRGQ